MPPPTLTPVPDDKIKALRKRFTPAEWEWIMADERCQNVMQGEALYVALFYLRFRVPGRLKAGAFWKEET